MTTILNANEKTVLEAIKKGHRYAGGDFTYAEEVTELCDLNTNQVKGYLSQLQKKGFITICDEYHQINFLSKSIEIFPDLEDTCYVY